MQRRRRRENGNAITEAKRVAEGEEEEEGGTLGGDLGGGEGGVSRGGREGEVIIDLASTFNFRRNKTERTKTKRIILSPFRMESMTGYQNARDTLYYFGRPCNAYVDA
jgi:hypothetical protein